MLKINHNAGFFSCCTIRLFEIMRYFEQYKCLPKKVDSSEQFKMYKKDISLDITNIFFKDYSENDLEITFKRKVDFSQGFYLQFLNYKNLDFESLSPFVQKYFSPSEGILEIKNSLVSKYNIDVQNCIGLYYRGTDKSSETQIDSFDSFYDKLKLVESEILNSGQDLDKFKILIQTDSGQFLDYINSKINHRVFTIKENSTSYTDRGIHNEKNCYENYIDIQNLYATFLIISECKYMICSSGNCSVWMAYYRGNGLNIHQSLNKEWV